MTKHEFKSRMTSFRMSLKKAARKSIGDFHDAMRADLFAASCLRPRFQPVVSRNVMMHIFSVGGLDAVRHIDSVEIRYN